MVHDDVCSMYMATAFSDRIVHGATDELNVSALLNSVRIAFKIKHFSQYCGVRQKLWSTIQFFS